MESCDDPSAEFSSISFDFDVFAEVARETDNFLSAVERRLQARGYESVSVSRIKSVLSRHPDLIVKAFCPPQPNWAIAPSYQGSVYTPYEEPRNGSMKYKQSIDPVEFPNRTEMGFDGQTHLSLVLSSMNLESGDVVHNTPEESNTSDVPDYSERKDKKTLSSADDQNSLAMSDASAVDNRDCESMLTALEPDLSEIEDRNSSSADDYNVQDVSKQSAEDISGCVSAITPSTTVRDDTISCSSVEDRVYQDNCAQDMHSGHTSLTFSADSRPKQSSVTEDITEDYSLKEFECNGRQESPNSTAITMTGLGLNDIASSYPSLSKPAEKYAEPPRLPAGSLIEVVVLAFNNPNEVIVQRLDLGKTIVEIESELSNHPRDILRAEYVCVGSPVVFEENDRSFRAVITGLLNDKEVCILMVDSGMSRNNILIEKLSLLSNEHAAVPPLSAMVTLNVVDDHQDWDDEVIHSMEKVCMEKWREGYLRLTGEMDMKKRGYLCGDLVTTDMMQLSLKNELNLHLTRKPVLGLHKNIIVKASQGIKLANAVDPSAVSQIETREAVKENPCVVNQIHHTGDGDQQTARKKKPFSFISRASFSRKVDEEEREKRRLLLHSTFPKFYENV